MDEHRIKEIEAEEYKPYHTETEAERQKRIDHGRGHLKASRYGFPAAIRNAPKIGRNEPCPCNSGKKLKKCNCEQYEPQRIKYYGKR